MNQKTPRKRNQKVPTESSVLVQAVATLKAPSRPKRVRKKKAEPVSPPTAPDVLVSLDGRSDSEDWVRRTRQIVEV